MPTAELIAVLPAAGTGSRLGIEGAKELVEVGPRGARQRPVIEWALHRARSAGVRRSIVVTTDDKPDLQGALARAANVERGPRVEVLSTAATPSSVHTIAVALAHEPAAHWLLVYPDILTAPSSATRKLRQRAVRSSADVVLALFPSDRPEKVDMVEVDERGRLCDLRIKEPDIGLRFTWAYACWRPTFSDLILEELASSGPANGPELHFGHLLRRALEKGLLVETLAFEDGFALDIGTRDDLRRVRRRPDPRFFE